MNGGADMTSLTQERNETDRERLWDGVALAWSKETADRPLPRTPEMMVLFDELLTAKYDPVLKEH